MDIALHVNGGQQRGWILRLAERLAALTGISVTVCPDATPVEPIAGLESLFQLERVLGRKVEEDMSRHLPAKAMEAFKTSAAASPGLRIDFRCSAAPLDDSIAIPVWSVTFDGVRGEQGLLAAILNNRLPKVEIRTSGHVVATGNPGTEYGGNVLGMFEDIMARTLTLIVGTVRTAQHNRLQGTEIPAAPDPTTSATPNLNLPKRALRKLASAVIRRIYTLCFHAPHWRVGWRATHGRDLYDLRRHPDSGWSRLPDDGSRFYADPFPIHHEGVTILFVEDYVHRLGKGLISAVAFGQDGPLGQPVPVMEIECHLSYPNVFARDGEIWMIPESCAIGTIDLYRATRFPGGWVKEATLVSGVAASDATFVEHEGRFWMFATVRDGGGAFSDALHLWSAPDFRGPWTAHALNPVLIDIGSARPAGQFVKRAGAIYRPFQDCRHGYGAAMGISRVTRLDDQGFEQEIETLLEPGKGWKGSRLHSLNGVAGLEFIDGSGFAPRVKSLLR